MFNTIILGEGCHPQMFVHQPGPLYLTDLLCLSKTEITMCKLLNNAYTYERFKCWQQKNTSRLKEYIRKC